MGFKSLSVWNIEVSNENGLQVIIQRSFQARNMLDLIHSEGWVLLFRNSKEVIIVPSKFRLKGRKVCVVMGLVQGVEPDCSLVIIERTINLYLCSLVVRLTRCFWEGKGIFHFNSEISMEMELKKSCGTALWGLFGRSVGGCFASLALSGLISFRSLVPSSSLLRLSSLSQFRTSSRSGSCRNSRNYFLDWSALLICVPTREGASFVPPPEEPKEPKQEVDIIGKNWKGLQVLARRSS